MDSDGKFDTFFPHTKMQWGIRSGLPLIVVYVLIFFSQRLDDDSDSGSVEMQVSSINSLLETSEKSCLIITFKMIALKSASFGDELCI